MILIYPVTILLQKNVHIYYFNYSKDKKHECFNLKSHNCFYL